MGRSYLFECLRCGYRAYVAGGLSDGAWFTVQTVRCCNCPALHDAVVEMKFAIPPLSESKLRLGLKTNSSLRRLLGLKQPPPVHAVLNRLPPSGAKSYRWIKFPPACPVSARHRVEVWSTPGKCPKCEWFLEASPLPFRTWD